MAPPPQNPESPPPSAKPGPAQAPKSPDAPASPGNKKKHDLDDINEFRNTGIITSDDIEKVFEHYKSPLKGKGKDLADVAQSSRINPALMLAIIQKESSYGKGGEIHEANPFSVHFRTRGQLQKDEKPIDMLRPKPGALPTFKQSAEGAAKTINKLAGANEKKPFSSVAGSYSEKPEEWKSDVAKFYLGILKRVGKS